MKRRQPINEIMTEEEWRAWDAKERQKLRSLNKLAIGLAVVAVVLAVGNIIFRLATVVL